MSHLIVSVDPRSPAERAGVRAGDEKATAAACREALEGIRALEGELAKAYAGYLLVQQVIFCLVIKNFGQQTIAFILYLLE